MLMRWHRGGSREGSRSPDDSCLTSLSHRDGGAGGQDGEEQVG